MPRKRRDPRQTTLAFRPAGRGGARPGAGRKRVRKSRVPHRTREGVPAHCPVHVTLRVLDGLPGLRRAAFVRAFRETLRRMSRPGFRVVHYSVQDTHAHFLVEAAGKERLANGMKSRRLRAAGTARSGVARRPVPGRWGLGPDAEPARHLAALAARFARCVNRVFERTGKVLADRFHHVVKRTPTEVRRALAYVLLNVRKHYRERCRRKPPVVLDGASSGLWFDGWKGREPPPFGRYADADRDCEVAAPHTWLLAKGWRRIGLIDPAEVPGGKA